MSTISSFPTLKGTSSSMALGGGDEMLDWGMQFFWVPKVVVQDSGCEVADRFREGSPLIWAGASSESQPQIQEDELIGRQLGAALHCCLRRKIASSESGFEIDLASKNPMPWVFSPRGDGPIDEPP